MHHLINTFRKKGGKNFDPLTFSHHVSTCYCVTSGCAGCVCLPCGALLWSTYHTLEHVYNNIGAVRGAQGAQGA